MDNKTCIIFRLYSYIYIIGFQFFLAVANRGVNNSKPSYSVIYRWSSKRKRFRTHQELLTWDARDIEYFQIEDLHYLIVANHKQGNYCISPYKCTFAIKRLHTPL